MVGDHNHDCDAVVGVDDHSVVVLDDDHDVVVAVDGRRDV